MSSRLGRAALWGAAGFLLGASALAVGEGDEDLREKLIELERLSAKLRALDGERAGLQAPNENGFEFDVFPIVDLVAGVPGFQQPQPFERNRTELFSGVADEAPQPYGTIEEIMEMIRVRVRPHTWEHEGARIGCLDGSIFVFAKPDVNREVRAFIDKELRPGARCTVNLEIEVVEAPEPVGGALAAAAGAELDAALRTRLDEAIAAGKAKRIFAGCIRTLSHQQVVLWHGAQQAVLADADPALDPGADAVDPVVDIELLGTIVHACSTVAADRVRVQISLENNVADRPARTVTTERAGVIQMPARAKSRMEADLQVKGDCWAVAAGSGGTERRRFLLVRPTVIGGAR